MRDRLILLPGWGLGTAPLQPLAEALRGLDPRLHVDIEPLPTLDSSNGSGSISTCRRGSRPRKASTSGCNGAVPSPQPGSRISRSRMHGRLAR